LAPRADENLTGSTSAGIQLNTHYGTSPPTNASATPVVRNITVRDVSISSGSFMNCVGLSDAPIYGILLDNVSVRDRGGVDRGPTCSDCTVRAINVPAGASADPCEKGPPPPPPPEPRCNLTEVLGCFDDTARGSILPDFQPQTHDRTTVKVCAAACAGTKAKRDAVAGIDGGNHCYCGAAGDLAKAAAKAKARPAAECQAMACRGDARITRDCGGQNRLIAYAFACEAPPEQL
jgi:hypothetical protein